MTKAEVVRLDLVIVPVIVPMIMAVVVEIEAHAIECFTR